MINLSTLFRFLTFDADAIRTVATSRSATWLGLLFVISAGFAREYDGEYLIAEPWHVLIPIAASLIGCFFMVVLLYLIAVWNVKVSFLRTFRVFLNVYWMTAPMAWLYAIPVEQFFDPGDATRANLYMLALVAIWRVALMVRCVQVIYKSTWFSALVPVMLFSDVLAMTAIALVPGPIFMIMGGVRLSESEQIILGIRIWLQLAGYLSLPIWFFSFLWLGTSASGNRIRFRAEDDTDRSKVKSSIQQSKRKTWQWTLPTDEHLESDGVSKASWGLAALAILIWLPILPMTQPGQWLRWKSEKLIRANDFEGFAKLTLEYPESDFPRHWDPPPRLAYREKSPSPFKAIVDLRNHNAAPWILKHYERKILELGSYGLTPQLHKFSDRELVVFVDTLAQLRPNEILEYSDRYHFAVRSLLEDDIEEDPDSQLSEARRNALEKLISLMSAEAQEKAIPDPDDSY